MGIKTLRPPHYAAHKPEGGHYIYRGDDSVDRERFERELSEMGAAAVARRTADPEADISDLLPNMHPLERYWQGEHRYDLDAVDYFMGKPVKIRDYFCKGTPIVFVLRRLSPEQWHVCNRMRSEVTRAAVLARKAAADRGEDPATVVVDDSKVYLSSLKACRLGLADIIDGPFKLTLGAGGEVSDATMDALQAADPDLPIYIGTAILLGYCKPLTDSEKKV